MNRLGAALAAGLLFCESISAAPPQWVEQLARTPRTAAEAEGTRILLQDREIRLMPESQRTVFHDRIAFLVGGRREQGLRAYRVVYSGKRHFKCIGAWCSSTAGTVNSLSSDVMDIVCPPTAVVHLTDVYVAILNFRKYLPGTVVALDYERTVDQLRDCGSVSLQDEDADTDTLHVWWSVEPPGRVALCPYYADNLPLHLGANRLALGPTGAWKPTRYAGSFALAAPRVDYTFYPDGNVARPPKTWPQVAGEVVKSWSTVDRAVDDKEYQHFLEETGGVFATLDTLISRYESAFRYSAVESEQTAMIPREPQDVLRTKYGDCKDLALLMTELLQRRGVQIYPVLLSVPRHRPFNPHYPNLGFNHAITVMILGTDTIYYDATCCERPGAVRFGNLPRSDQGCYALWVREGSNLTVTPAAAVPRSSTAMRGALDVNGSFSGTVTFAMDTAGEMLFPPRVKQEDVNRFVHQALREDLFFEINSWQLSRDHRHLSAEISISGYAQNAGSERLVTLFPFRSEINDTLERPLPSGWFFSPPEQICDTVAIRLPAGPVERCADSLCTLSAAGVTRFQYRLSSDSLIAVWYYVRSEDHYPPERFSGLDSLFKAACTYRRTMIRLL